MKKIAISFLSILLFLSTSLTGCAAVTEILQKSVHVDTLYGWMFQENNGTNDYSVFFGFKDEKGKEVAADASVDIRIVNDENEDVYISSGSITKNDFSMYSSTAAGNHLLANIRIAKDQILPGKSNSGTVYIKVTAENAVFDEVNCQALYCLPVMDFILKNDDFPQEIKIKDIWGDNAGKLQILEVSFEPDGLTNTWLTVTVKGEKLSGESKDVMYDTFSWKLYDAENYVVNSGDVFLDNLKVGDKFKEDIYIYDVTPGVEYKIVFKEYEK